MKTECIQGERIGGLEKSLEQIQLNYIRLEERQKAQYDLVDRTMNAIAKNANMVVDIDARTKMIEKKLDNGINEKLNNLETNQLIIKDWVDRHGDRRKAVTKQIQWVDDIFNIIQKHLKIIAIFMLFALVALGIITITDFKDFLLKLAGAA